MFSNWLPWLFLFINIKKVWSHFQLSPKMF